MTLTAEVDSSYEVTDAPRLFLRVEALTLLVASAWAYHASHGNWILFAALFLLPDVAMLGYLVNLRIGAACYNLAHTTVISGILLAVGFLTNYHLAFEIGLIGLSHVGFDRFVGYGLKYPDSFGHTHLGLVGKSAK